MMKAHFRLLLLFGAVCLLPVPLTAQGVQLPAAGSYGEVDTSRLRQHQWIVAGKVTTLEGDPIRGAKVLVRPATASAEFRILETDLQGGFHTDYMVSIDYTERLREFSVDLTVTKKGFLKAHRSIDFSGADKAWLIPVTLRSAQEDPNLLLQADLISSLGPRLKKLGASDGLSASEEKDYARGVEEFLDRKRSDRALQFFTKVARDPSCVECHTMLGLAQLDSGDWDGANQSFVEAVKETLADRTVRRPEPLLACGVMESWRHEPKKAAGYFVEALKFAPQDALALQELGRSQLLLQNWGVADDYLSKALDAGAGPEVRLLRVEALLGTGDSKAANKEMIRYLDGRDVKKMPLRFRELWAQVQNRMKVEAAYAKGSSDVDQPIDYLHRPIPELKGLEPAASQEQLDSILGAVGENVAAFFRSFPNTSSLEQIRQQELRRKGKVGEAQEQKFRYLCFTPVEAWGPGFREYRTDLAGSESYPQGLKKGFMLTLGFASASLIFHPVYQPEAAFRYLGHQKVNGRDTFVIAFAQRPTKARVFGTFQSGQTSVATLFQGLAWVDSESRQIIHLRTDLLAPLPEIKLERETTEIDFVEVHFKGIAEGFWLPRQVTVTVGWNGKHLRNEHQYSEFKLFNVEFTQKIGNPKGARPASDEAVDPKTPR
jgi:tetratricopeptide (TPR) repeat protein